MFRHHLMMSGADLWRLTGEAFKANDRKKQQEWARGVLQTPAALEFARTQIQNSSSVDVDLIARVLSTRCYELREEYEEDRPQLWFLDMFRSRGLLYPITRGVRGYVSTTRDYAAGEIRFIGDKTDDWPTSGGHTMEPTLKEVKYYAGAVEYGILELWQSSYEGKDIVAERVRDKFVDFDEFVETLIAQGAPLHGFYGFIGHPDIPVNVVPPSVINPPFTEWPDKTPEEVVFDFQAMRDTTRLSSNYNTMADTLILADNRYSYVNAAQIGTNGDNILSRWLENERRSAVGGMTNIVPFVPYDTAGPGDTPIAMAGRFTRENLEMPFMPPEQLPTEYHGSKWKIGFVGAAGSVNVKRSGRFQQFQGI